MAAVPVLVDGVITDMALPAQASDCSAYNCGVIALEQSLDTIFVTCDEKVLARFPELAMRAGQYVQYRC